jgi:Uma2 family endonuclease
VARIIGNEVETRRLRRVEYDRLVDLGVFDGERIELLDGLLVVREPQRSAHAIAVQLVQKALERAFGATWHVRTQLPFGLDDDSEPEPDAVVVRGKPRDYSRAHPTRCALIVEVADGSLLFDRRKKGLLYARAGVADFWIVNLKERVVEVYREPRLRGAAPLGWHYAHTERMHVPARVTPLAAPRARIPIADLLP